MERQSLIEQISRLVHNGFPSDDSDITDELINLYINQGIGLAVKNNYKEAIQLDGIGYVNNSFYSTFKGVLITEEEQNLYTLALPVVPIAIGRNEGVSRLVVKNKNLNISYDLIPLTTNQLAIERSNRKIPNKVLYYIEGKTAKIITSLNMTQYTASVTVISGGADSTGINAPLNVPDDMLPIVIDYCTKSLIAGLNIKPDSANDGVNKA